jgi:hypothetical protein
MVLMPVVLGGGKPFFGEAFSRTELKLVESSSFENGAQMLLYDLV